MRTHNRHAVAAYVRKADQQPDLLNRLDQVSPCVQADKFISQTEQEAVGQSIVFLFFIDIADGKKNDKITVLTKTAKPFSRRYLNGFLFCPTRPPVPALQRFELTNLAARR